MEILAIQTQGGNAETSKAGSEGWRNEREGCCYKIEGLGPSGEAEAIAGLLRDMLSVEIGDDAGDMLSLEVKPEKESAKYPGFSYIPASNLWPEPPTGQTYPEADIKGARDPSCDTGQNWGPARPESRRKSIFTTALVETPLREWLRRPGQILVTHVSWAEEQSS